MHPEANNSSPLSDDPKIREKQIELRARMAEHGRSISKSLFAKQPDWCPLMRELVLLRCPDCKKEKQVERFWVWPKKAAVVEFRCPKCCELNQGDSLRYLDKHGNEIAQ